MKFFGEGGNNIELYMGTEQGAWRKRTQLCIGMYSWSSLEKEEATESFACRALLSKVRGERGPGFA